MRLQIVDSQSFYRGSIKPTVGLQTKYYGAVTKVSDKSLRTEKENPSRLRDATLWREHDGQLPVVSLATAKEAARNGADVTWAPSQGK